jgi:predicted RecB family nuclease
MAAKINRRVLESYFACKFKAHLKLSSVQDAPSEYLNIAHEEDRRFTRAAQRRLLKTPTDDVVPTRVTLTRSLLSAGSPLILDATFEDERVSLQFDGIMKLDGLSALGSFHYVPILFYDGGTVRQPQKQLLEVYAAVLQALQDRAPSAGIVHCKGDIVARVRLSPDETAAQSVLQELMKIQDGDIPTLRLNDHCQICEFRQQCRGQAVKEDNISLLRGISDTEIARLHSKGIFTVNQLSYTFRARRIAKRAKAPSSPHHFALQALAIREGKVFVHGNPILRCPGTRVYLDIEGTPETRSHYLIGLMTVVDHVETHHAFWADDETSEISIFLRFLDQLDREGRYSLVHYGSYEIKALRQIRQKVPVAYQSRIDDAIKSSLNLLSIIRPYIYFPTYSNGLKEIAGYLKYSWSDPSSSGPQSLIWRQRWLQGERSYKEKLLRYNQDDCSALRRVTEFIETIICPGTPSSPPTQAHFVHTSALSKDNDQGALFGKKEFVLEDFSRINECAYFDYQRDRVFARDREPHRRGVHKIRKKSDLTHRINRTIEVRRSNCPKCGGRKVQRMQEVSRRIIDLRISQSGIKRWITRYDAHEYRCNRCKEFFTPLGYPTGSRYGRALIGWCIYQHIRYGINLSQICSIVAETFGIPLRVPAMYRFKATVAHHYAARYAAVLQEIIIGRALYVDETPVNLWKSKGYVWVFATARAVYFFYKDSREGSFLPDMLNGFNGVLISDFFTAYDALNMPQQRCLIHLMRDLNDELLRHPFDVEFKQFGQVFSSVLRGIVETIDRYGLKKRRLRKHKPLSDRFCRWATETEFHSEVSKKYQKRVDKYRDKLFTFLDHDGVAWNNNNAEHAMKCFARYRRFADGRMTKKSVQDYLVILSIFQTCEYQGKSFLAELIGDDASQATNFEDSSSTIGDASATEVDAPADC